MDEDWVKPDDVCCPSMMTDPFLSPSETVELQTQEAPADIWTYPSQMAPYLPRELTADLELRKQEATVDFQTYELPTVHLN